MTDLVWDFEVDGGNFELAGSASQTTKSRLKQLGLPNETVRKVIIAMYEGEINMVIHADGGVATVTVGPKEIKVVLKDTGKGIENIPLAMKEGYSTASSEIRDLGICACNLCSPCICRPEFRAGPAPCIRRPDRSS